jgi:hypothetical protein
MAGLEHPADRDASAAAEGSVRALRRAMAASPGVVTPQLARSLQATENHWRNMGAECGLLTSGQVAELLGASPSNRNLASRKRAAHQIAGVARGNAVLYPGFQFDRTRGAILPVMELLIRLATANGWTDEDLLLWLYSPTTSFADEGRPIDHLHDPDSVLAAAKAAFEAE